MTPAEKLSQSKPRPTRKPTNHLRTWQCAVRRERERLSLTLADVSEETGITKSSLSLIERGSDMMLTTAWKLSEFFGKPIDELWRKP